MRWARNVTLIGQTRNVDTLLAYSQNCEKQLLASSYLSVCPSVCAHGTTRLPLDGFSRNLISEHFFRKRTEKLLIIKPTRCTNFHWTHSNGICHTDLLTACEQNQGGTAVLSWSCSQAVSKPVWHIPLLCVQWKTPDDWQRNCPKHVEFYSKINIEKLVHLVSFIIQGL